MNILQLMLAESTIMTFSRGRHKDPAKRDRLCLLIQIVIASVIHRFALLCDKDINMSLVSFRNFSSFTIRRDQPRSLAYLPRADRLSDYRSPDAPLPIVLRSRHYRRGFTSGGQSSVYVLAPILIGGLSPFGSLNFLSYIHHSRHTHRIKRSCPPQGRPRHLCNRCE